MKYLLLIPLFISCKPVSVLQVDEPCPIGVAYEDRLLRNSVCRTWTVVDWCRYDGNKGLYMYTEFVDLDAEVIPPPKVLNKERKWTRN